MSNLLDLARKFDATADLDERCKIAEEMRPLLGERYQEFDEKFAALLIERPAFPWPAEAVARSLSATPENAREIVRYIETDDDLFSVFGCGCSYSFCGELVRCARDLAQENTDRASHGAGLSWHHIAIMAHNLPESAS